MSTHTLRDQRQVSDPAVRGGRSGPAPGAARRRAAISLGVWTLFFILSLPSRSPAANYALDWDTVAGGGGTVTAGHYSLGGTIGQPDASATAPIGPYALTGGFWSPLALFVTNSSQSNIWINVSGGSWTNQGNWVNNIIATNANITADFSELSLTNNTTVTLDGARTIGGLIFADQNGAYNWTLNTGSGGPLALGGNAPTINVVNQAATINLALAGTQGLTKNGAGLLVLTQPVGYTGGTTNNAGFLQLMSNFNTSSNAPLTINGGVVESAATFFLNVAQAATTAGTTNVVGPGTLRLISTINNSNNPDLYFGQDVSGVIYFGAQMDASNLDLGSTHRYIYAKTGHNSVARYRGWEDARINGNIIGAGGITYIAQNNSAGTGGNQPMECPLVLAGSNTFSGGLEIQRGSVYLLNPFALSAGNSLLMDPISGNNARFFLYGNNTTVSNLASSGAGAALIANGNVDNNFASIPAAALTVNETVNTTFGGTLVDTQYEYDFGSFTSGPLSLGKTGPATLTLTGASTYTGATTVTAGTLMIDGSLASPATVTVSAGATLAGNGSVAGPVTVSGAVAPGTNRVGTLATGSETWNPGGDFVFDVTNASLNGGSQLNITGGLTVAATSGNPFVIYINSQTIAGGAGPINGFNSATSQTWTLATTTTGFTGFAPSVLAINTTGLANPFPGTFSVATNGHVLQLVYTGPSYPASAPSDLVAWWPGNGNAIDVVGGNNGTLDNAVTYVPGEVEQAFALGGSSAMVVAANRSSLQLQNFTIEAWVKRSSTTTATLDTAAVGGNAMLFAYGSQGYGLAINASGQLLLSKIDVDSLYPAANVAITDTSAFHHVAVTKAGDSVVFYLDGVAYPAASAYADTFSFSTSPAIGGRSDHLNAGNNDSFYGDIDEMSIYSRALSPAEIQSVYTAGTAGKVVTDNLAYLIAGNGSFGVIDLASGVFTTLGNAGQTLAGLGVQGTHLYAASYKVTPGELYSINAVNGGLSPVGSMAIDLEDLGSTTAGLFALDTSANLYSINAVTGAATLIGPTGLSYGYWSQLSTGGDTLYFANGTSLYTLNQGTGAATLIDTTASTQLGSMVWEDGILYAGQEEPSFNVDTVNPTTGAATVGPVPSGTPSAWGLAPDPLTSPAVPAPSGLVAWWPGNGNTIDVVGGNNGVLTNGETYAAGEVQQAFSGTNNHAGVFIGNPTALQLQNFTIEGWIQRASTSVVSSDPSANGGAAGIFYFGHYGYGVGIHQANGAISLTQIDNNDVNDGSYGACVTDLNWHHVAVTKSGATVTFYIDGIAYPTVSDNVTFQFNTPCAIGVRGDLINQNNNDSFDGNIDELSIYNRALTASEVLSIYNAGMGGKYINPVSLTLSGGATGEQISWPVGVSTILQQTTNLVTGTGWVPSAYNITTANGTNTVSFTPPVTGNLFFRLMGQ